LHSHPAAHHEPHIAHPQAPKLLRLRRKDSMMVGRQINKRTRDGAQMYRHPAHAYALQAAPRPVVAMKDRERWHCDVCGYEWSPDGEQKKRYMSVNPREVGKLTRPVSHLLVCTYARSLNVIAR